MTFFSILFLSDSSRSEWPVVYRLNFMWITGYFFTFRFNRFGPVHPGMYSHPVLVSKVVSIPRFGLLLCPSLYMRSSRLTPINPPSRAWSPFTHFIASLPNYLHSSLPYDMIPMPYTWHQAIVPSRRPAWYEMCATERPTSSCSVTVKDVYKNRV